ncbi:MAG: hypothetical protein L0Z46_10270 [Nitrospiraceae bacterium]|nr:hypothetical protein [Nitrospiraceae bacterium]
MSQTLDARLKESGTRFLIYPQHKSLKGFTKPEIVYLNAVPGTIRAGPEDHAIYVVDAMDKPPYEWPQLPPYTGPRHPPAKPDMNGHFDNIKPTERAFSSATMFATVRRVLDIWEDFFGRNLPWFFRVTYPRLELIPRVEWDNAHSGYGFLEFGFGRTPGGIDHTNPYCENFDVLAHELGHSIKNEVIGWPTRDRETLEYRGHHEAFGDLVAIVASLHFETVVDHLLEYTKGNLFSANELARVGELSKTREIRRAFNYEKMSTVNRGEEHDLSLPFTGGAFDVFVEIYEQNLIERGAITKELGERSYNAQGAEIPGIQQEFQQYFKNKKKDFYGGLVDARDYFGKLMARAWDKTSKNDLYYSKVLTNMIDADVELSGGKYGRLIRDNFEWREITTSVDPQLLKTRRLSECSGELPPLRGQ